MHGPRYSQVDPDIEARATVEKSDLQCLQLVSVVHVSWPQPGAISGQVHFVDPFSDLEQPPQLVLGDIRDAVEEAKALTAEAMSLLWVYRRPKWKPEFHSRRWCPRSHGSCWGQANSMLRTLWNVTELNPIYNHM